MSYTSIGNSAGDSKDLPELIEPRSRVSSFMSMGVSGSTSESVAVISSAFVMALSEASSLAM